MSELDKSIANVSGKFRDRTEIIEQSGANLRRPESISLIKKIIDKALGHFAIANRKKEPVLLPSGILRNIENAPATKVEDIFTFEDPTLSLTEDELRYLIHVVGPAFGPEEISFPSPLEKILHLPALLNPDIYPIPEYKHSCPDIDKILMGMVPYSNFVDTSRAGLAMLLAKAFEYARRSANKYVKNNEIDYSVMDERTKQFVQEFGLISCAPITDRSTLFDFAQQNELEIYSIGGSSIAESFYAACRIFGNSELKEQISTLAGGGWLNGEDRDGTSKLKTKFLQYLSRHYPTQKELLSFEETSPELKQYLEQRYPNHPQPHVQFLADAMMEMVKKYTLLPESKKGKQSFWMQNAYGSHTRLERVSTKDVSEIVLRRKSNDQEQKPLPPMPWKTFVLYPHTTYEKDGSQIAQFSTMEQLVKAAELIKKYYPNSIVYIPTKNGQPTGYNIEEEKKVKAGHKLSGTNAMLAFITHLATNS